MPSTSAANESDSKTLGGLIGRVGCAARTGPQPASGRPESCEELVDALARLLRELCELIHCLPDAHFTQSPVGVMPSSIACHVRHSLDHISALLASADSAYLDYDRRKRGTAIEHSRRAAMDAILELIDAVHLLRDRAPHAGLTLHAIVTPESEPVQLCSTLGRELVYVQSHMIHHNALIAAMVKTLGGNTPERFGWAPSTIRHLEQRPCAR